MIQSYSTLITLMALIKCMRSIKEYVFVTSEYPDVITLEGHLTPDFQAKLARLVAWNSIGIQNVYIQGTHTETLAQVESHIFEVKIVKSKTMFDIVHVHTLL